MDPNKIVVDFNSSGDAWYDNTELVKLIATDNELEYIDERLGQEFGALVTLDVSELYSWIATVSLTLLTKSIAEEQLSHLDAWIFASIATAHCSQLVA